MKSRIQVLSVAKREGRASSGKDYSMTVCQCAVFQQDASGNEQALVGELVLPKNHPDVSIGLYEADFGVSISQDKKIGGRLLGLTPIRTTSQAAPPKP